MQNVGDGDGADDLLTAEMYGDATSRTGVDAVAYPPITVIRFPPASTVRSQSRSSQLRSGRTSNTTNQPWSKPTVSR